MAQVKEPPARPASPEQRLAREEAAFRRKLPLLLRRYAGQFVAIRGGRLVGHGPDDRALALRMYRQFGSDVLLIARVEESPTVYELARGARCAQ
ncbi:MAG: hypothetical protein FJ291_21250 [Planctomycetes bacterium]|nr:hypothetical protein [Planctomycetota bacterium]